MQSGRNFPRRGLPPVSQHHASGHAPPARPQQEDPARRMQLRQLSHVPTDREIPDGVENMVLGDVVQRYRALREAERKLDSVMINKRLAARDSGHRYERRLRTMRVWINCVSTDKENDTRMDDAFEFGDDAGSGNFKMRIEGRLLPEDSDDSDDEDLDDVQPGGGETMDLDKPTSNANKTNQQQKSSNAARQKLSHYFKQITFSFNPSPHALPSAHPPAPIEWKKPEPGRDGTHPTGDDANFDALEFERKLEEGVQSVTITLQRAEPHGRVRGKLSPALARLLDRDYEDQSGAMMGLYNYVRLKGLEQEGNPQNFHCDDALRAIFKSETSSFIYAPEKIAENIQPLPAVTLPFTIRLSSNPAPATIYDVPVLVDDPLDIFASHFRSVTNPHHPAFHQRLQDIHLLDKDIALAVQGMYASRGKVSFLNGLATDPVTFIRKWVQSQQADEEIILAEEKSRGQEWHKGGVDGIWGSVGARESVGLMLARRP